MIETTSILALTWPLKLEYLTWWQAILLFVGLGLPITWLAVRSLAGLGPVRRWVALGIRLAVLLLLVLIVGGARWQRENKIVEVMVLRDVSESMGNARNATERSLQTAIDNYLKSASAPERKEVDDRIGQVSFHASPLIDAIPNTTLALDTRAIRETGRGTDIAAAIQLALATLGKDAMHRLLLISDGNVTQGDVEAAAAAAAAQHVPIDVMPISFDLKDEVLVERFISPTWRRENEPFTIEVILRATNFPVTGKLTVLHRDQPMDLDPTQAGVQPTRTVTLRAARNVERVEIPAPAVTSGIHKFKAVFEADNVAAEVARSGGTPVAGQGGLIGDTLTQNNAADAFTFVRGKGRVLYVNNVLNDQGDLLRQALANQEITLETISVEQFPRSLIELQNYDSVILANVPRGAGGLGEEEQKSLASYVHDMGGGLVMIGGENSFGAGGWQGSKLEEVLPVNMDIPSQRQMPKGALVLIMHSCEMPNGNYWGEQCAIKAVETLSARDEIGVISYDWGRARNMGTGGSQWDFPLSEKGDGSKVVAAIKNMRLGDMPSFDDSMNVALNGINNQGGLIRSDAKQKHVIIISDGDPQRPNQQLVDQYTAAKVSVSTVAVYPHDRSDRGLPPTMQDIAKMLKGRAHGPIDSNPNQLPQIFIKEATVVRRSLIHEDGRGIPVKLNENSTSELVQGLTELPSITGLVLTSKKESPQVEMPLVVGNNSDPLLAHWQTGLGKAAAWTSDAHNKWAAQWVAFGGYEKFWAQVVRSVSRPAMSRDVEVRMVQNGDKGKIVVEALTQEAGFLNFLTIQGQVMGPDGNRSVRLVQTGPGAYESEEFDASQAGTYVGVLSWRDQKGVQGVMPAGMAVNSSPELRDLKSNEGLLLEIARRTGGRRIEPFEAESADLFSRDGLMKTASPLPIWDILIPILLATIILDVAVRRIAWDWLATKRAAVAVGDYIKSYTTVRQVEAKPTLDALKRVREEVAEQKFKVDETRPLSGVDAPAPDRKFKFEAKQGVEGDISQVVGGASDKPIPKAPKKPEPKGAQPGAYTGSLLEAKRRAQQQIREKEQDDQ